MAWQLHYTSARGSSRSGFQFTASSPGLPPRAEADVAPYLGYRPPPDAPPSPSEDELDAFPVSLSYDVVGGRPLLVRSRYLGKDYSGRFGNFLAHAVLAEPAELEGLRPIEFWDAAFWDDAPREYLPGLDDPPPGDAFDPESLGHWLRGLDHEPYARLAGLIDSTEDRVVLVSEDAGEIARWIAVLSYSLPVPAAARLSFTTYTADPVASPHQIAGTTPDVWAGLRSDLPAHFLDSPAPPAEPSRYANAVVTCWRELDLEGLDALAELADLGEDAYEPAAVLLSACRGTALGSSEQRLAGSLLSRPGLPSWVWPRLDPKTLGFDLASAVHLHSPMTVQASDSAEYCARLALSMPELRPRLGDIKVENPKALVPPLAKALSAATDLTALAELTKVATGLDIPVLTTQTQRAAYFRINPRGAEVSDVTSHELCAALRTTAEEWRAPMLAGMVDGLERGGSQTRRDLMDSNLCDALADLVDEAPLGRTPEVALHLLRSLAERHGVHAAQTVKLAEGLKGNKAAEGLLAAAGVATERDPVAAARAIAKVQGALAAQIVQSVADALTERSPSFRAALLGLLEPRQRDRIIHRWIETAQNRAKRFELVSVTLRSPGTPLDDWVRSLTSKRLTLLQLDAYFRDDQKLRTALRELRG